MQGWSSNSTPNILRRAGKQREFNSCVINCKWNKKERRKSSIQWDPSFSSMMDTVKVKQPPKMSRVLTEYLKGLSRFRIAVMSLGWISDRFSGYVTRSCMWYVWTHWLVGYWMALPVADVALRRVVAWLMSNKLESISNQALLAWFKDNILAFFWRN